MGILPQSLSGTKVHVPAFKITVGGVPLAPSDAKRVTNLSIRSVLNAPSSFTINLNNQELYFLKRGKGVFAEGAEVAIWLGYAGETLSPMILGDVVRLDAEFPTDSALTLTVTGFDLMHRLARSTHPQAAEQATPADLLKNAAQEQGMLLEIDPRISPPASKTFEYIAQTQQHDLEFLMGWARKLGWAVWMDGNVLHVDPAEAPLKEMLILRWGRELMNFSASLGIAELVQNIEVRGRNPRRDEDYTGKAALRPEFTVHLHRAARERIAGTRLVTDQRRYESQKDADDAANAVLQTLADKTTNASGTCVGIPELRAGMQVRLEGLGRFDGTYHVLSATHTLGNNGYQTAFEIGLGSESGSEAEVGETERRFLGVLPGVVIDVNDQKEKMGRVRVRFPSLPSQVQSDWARVAVPMAGQERGIEFLPEVNDEVLVAFESGDFHRPYVLGGLWHSAAKPPESNPLDSEGKKVVKRVIKSRAGHLIRLDDTDGAEKIEIIDKSGKNLISVDTKNNTITIHSEKDILLDAPNGKVAIKASDLEVTATQKGSIEGSNGLDLKSSSGEVNIRGNKVNIN